MSDKNAKVGAQKLRFARSATRHRISKDRIRHVIANHFVSFPLSAPAARAAGNSTRTVFLGDDAEGVPLEVLTVELDDESALVIHAMRMREKYGDQYRKARR